MNVDDVVRGQVDDLTTEFWDKSLQAKADAIDRVNTIAPVKLQNYGPDDVVQAGAQTAACHQSTAQFAGIKKNAVSGPGLLETGRFLVLLDLLEKVRRTDINGHPLVIANE